MKKKSANTENQSSIQSNTTGQFVYGITLKKTTYNKHICSPNVQVTRNINLHYNHNITYICYT